MNQWSFGCRVLSPCSPVAASTACGAIWVLGGESTEVYKYLPMQDEWSQMAISMPGPVVKYEIDGVVSEFCIIKRPGG